jgi:hypothetical protein
MFAKSFIVASIMALGAIAAPFKPASAVAARSGWEVDTSRFSPNFSFNNWRGFNSLNDFDSFYGADNFDGGRFNQVVVKENELVCRSQRVEIIQQRLAVIQELSKRIISELICDVETQVIVFQQFHSGLGRFKGDLRRVSGFRAGFDNGIAGRFRDIFNERGDLTDNHLGFNGLDIGRDTFIVGGSNWDDKTSFKNVNDAYLSARHAHRLANNRFDFD